MPVYCKDGQTVWSLQAVESQLAASDPAENEIDTESVDESPENLPLDTPSSLLFSSEEPLRKKAARKDLTGNDEEDLGSFVKRDEEYDERLVLKDLWQFLGLFSRKPHVLTQHGGRLTSKNDLDSLSGGQVVSEKNI